MKKWYHEEYEFQIEVIGFLRGDHTSSTAETAKKLEIRIPAPMAALSTQLGRAFAPKS